MSSNPQAEPPSLQRGLREQRDSSNAVVYEEQADQHAVESRQHARAVPAVVETHRLIDPPEPVPRRLADGGRMPRPVRLGGLVRWRRAELQAWIDAGCPSTHPTKGAAT